MQIYCCIKLFIKQDFFFVLWH
uniref:Uncharacterized protein n=1 Tax=Anguilla anguilla TaxID=7936 RepID=A0A0E9RTE7_ANGAN